MVQLPFNNKSALLVAVPAFFQKMHKSSFMKKDNPLFRQLALIRHTDRPYTYPSKADLLQVVSEKLHIRYSARTLERDFREFNEDLWLGPQIRYDRLHRGYYLYRPEDEDLSDFEAFLRLLEYRERLEMLTATFRSGPGLSRYIEFERNDRFKGSEHLPLIWQALQEKRLICFGYQAYGPRPPRVCRVEPGFLFEYRNRWYLDAWEPDLPGANKMRTFGLDRMQNLRLTADCFRTDRSGSFRQYRRHAIGVTCPPDALLERVVLRFEAAEAQYVLSLPLHRSQQVLPGSPEGFVDIALHVIINHELEKEILGYGEWVTVLEPQGLCQRIEYRRGRQ